MNDRHPPAAHIIFSNAWILFGDSYTTTGFDPDSTLPTPENPLGNPRFPGLTGGGGANFVGLFTRDYCQLPTHNYVSGGATIDADLAPPYLPFPIVRSLRNQVQRFLRDKADGRFIFSEALFTVWIGINDIANSYASQGDRFVFNDTLLDAYFALMRELQAAGARNILFINVPPIERTPLMLELAQETRTLVSSLVLDFNTKLAQRIESFKLDYIDVKIRCWDVHACFTAILDNPTVYGFSDAVHIGDSADFWGNDFHPSSSAHRIFAKEINMLVRTLEE
ncbi:fungal cellulose binding domain-containing protein [Mycena amicta]|nr:fungal cellulose binding domain-containing protein [Mycena amicta]